MRPFISFVAQHMQVQVHRHRCYQILLSLDKPFSSMIEGVLHTNKYQLVINQNVPHACKAVDGSALVYFVDSEGIAGKRLNQILGRKSFIDVGSRPLRLPWNPVTNDPGLVNRRWQSFADQTLEDILALNTPGTQPSLDPRVLMAIEFLAERLNGKVTLQDVAQHICLSSERTRHLFTKEVGTSLSQYLLWNRLKRCIDLIMHQQLSFTEAAHHSGFSDQSHFCRTFKRTFGVAANGILNNSRFIQFIHF